MPASWKLATRSRTTSFTSGSTSSHQDGSASAAASSRGRHTKKIVLLAAFLFLMCSPPSDSLLTGQLAVMSKPAVTSPVASASQAPEALWVNMSVITPSGLRTRRHSAKIAAIFSW